MATPINRKKARAALNLNLQRQTSALMVAEMLGDASEERARKRTVADLTRKIKRLDDDAARSRSLAVRSMRDQASRRNTRQRVDGLVSLLKGETPAITETHFRAALALREHAEAAGTGGGELKERVQGGSIDNCQMEGLCDRRRPMRYALNAACEAVRDQSVLGGAMLVIIEGRSLSHACEVAGISRGKGQTRIKTAIYEALDAASAHIGIAA